MEDEAIWSVLKDFEVDGDDVSFAPASLLPPSTGCVGRAASAAVLSRVRP